MLFCHRHKGSFGVPEYFEKKSFRTSENTFLKKNEFQSF